MNQLITAFNTGEVSPLLAGRVDLPNLARSCRRLRGFLPGITGGAFRRPPLLHAGMAAEGGSRLLPFQASAGSTCQLEASAGSLRVWPADGSGEPVSLAAPWTAAELDAIQCVQSNDVLWLVSPGRAPLELQHAPGGWTLTEMPWKYPPLRDENLSATTLTASGTEGNITLTASADLFEPGHAGAWWELSHYREALTAEIQVPVIPPAASVLTITGQPTAGQTVSIGEGDSLRVYTWRASAEAAYEVAIGGTVSASRDNLVNAINGKETGSTAGIGTLAHPRVSAEKGSGSTGAVKAAGILTCTDNNLTAGGSPDEVEIAGVHYTFTNATPPAAAYQVKRGADITASLGNLAKAINLTGTAGTEYGTGTVVHPDVTAGEPAGKTLTVTAKTGGVAGNELSTTVDHTSRLSWGADTLKGGAEANSYRLKVSALSPGLAGNGIPLAETMSGGAWSAAYTSGGDETGAVSEAIRVKGQWDFTTYGRWAGTVYIEQQNAAGAADPAAPGGWDVLRKVTGRMDTNRTLAGIVEGAALLRLRVEHLTGEESSGVPSPRFLLEAVESAVRGLVRITSVISSTEVEASVETALYSTQATPAWREGAFSTHRGHPAAVALHEQRLVFAGTAAEPAKLWASVAGDFRNFEQTGYDDGSWQYELATREGNGIRWVISQTGLIIGTDGDEWLMDGGEAGITPTNARASQKSAYGSDAVQPVPAGSVVLFVQRGGLALLEYVFDFQQAGFIAPDLTELVEHLTRGGLRAVALQRAPWPVVWAVTWDGQLLACSYARQAQVVAWAVQAVGGLVESVSCVRGARGLADEVWVVVNRQGSRRLERFAPDHWTRLHAGGVAWHMDAAAERVPSPGGTVTGLTHLEGHVAAVLADGLELPPRRVNAGAVSVPAGVSSVIVGLIPPVAELQPAVFDIPSDTGTSQGRKYHVPELAVRFYQSGECSWQDAPGREVYALNFRDAADDTAAPPPPFTGVKRISCAAGFHDSADTVLRAEGIHSMNVLSLTPRVQVYGT